MIVAAVQVRFGSTRLPGKALAEVLDRPVLWHIVRRVKAAQSIDQVVIATSDEPADAPIRDFCNEHRIPCFAGSELDLIDRLYKTARFFGADVIVRVTGDCPLADPGVVDELVSAYRRKPDDVAYVTNTLPPTYPDGQTSKCIP
jgi:spore coat polysaccharide biosynthesis protein SpsF (cytidylyltransferase family)